MIDMAALSDYAENALLDWINNVGTPTRPSSLFIALYTAAPSDTGGGTEVSGGAYARTAATFAAAAAGATSNTATITFPTATAAWGTVGWIGIFDASTAGNLLWHGAATANKTVGSGDVYRVLAGDLDLTLA